MGTEYRVLSDELRAPRDDTSAVCADIIWSLVSISKSDKTSLAIDRSKVDEAREILGTRTIAATVDAALDEVIRLGRRRQVLERVRRDGGLGPGPRELRRLRKPS